MYLSDDETCKSVIRMFMDLELITNYHIPYEVRREVGRKSVEHPIRGGGGEFVENMNRVKGQGRKPGKALL